MVQLREIFSIWNTKSTVRYPPTAAKAWRACIGSTPTETNRVRINYEADNGQIRGFNLMGIRYRHEVCEKWILDGKHVEEVLQDLGMANFDPEFYEEYEAEVVALYNRQTGKNLTLKEKAGAEQRATLPGLR